MNNYASGLVSANTNYIFRWNNARIIRIATESLDAAFEVCNDLEHFNQNKIFDVFDQTFPTAFVLSTGYWIFFVSNHGAPLCVCGRFGIVCRHVRSKNHWIDLQPIAEKSSGLVFNPRIYGPVIPTRYEITISSLNKSMGYVIKISLDLEYKAIRKKKFHVDIQASYGYAYQCYGPSSIIRFTPNPILKEQYGKYFNQLKNHRTIFMSKHGLEDLIVTPSSTPLSCLILISVNLEKHEFFTEISAILLSDWQLPESSKDASTQTTEDDELEHYKNLLEEVTNTIWKHHEHNTVNELPILNKYLTKTDQYSDVEISEYPGGREKYDIHFPSINTKKLNGVKWRNNLILNESIPKPISSPAVQNEIYWQNTAEDRIDRDVLPNFQDTFQNLDCTTSLHEIPSKRKRGRPKLLRTDASRSYSMVVRSRRTTNPSVDALQKFHLEGATHEQVHDPNFATLNNIFKKSKEKSKSLEGEDINFELDLIDQLIKEETQKNIPTDDIK